MTPFAPESDDEYRDEYEIVLGEVRCKCGRLVARCRTRALWEVVRQRAECGRCRVGEVPDDPPDLRWDRDAD